MNYKENTFFIKVDKLEIFRVINILKKFKCYNFVIKHNGNWNSTVRWSMKETGKYFIMNLENHLNKEIYSVSDMYYLANV